MPEQYFTTDEQIEIINIVKGVFRYAKKSKNVLHNESMMLDLLEQSCSKVCQVIKEKNELDNEPN